MDKKRFFNFFFWNFRETTRYFSLRSQNSEYPRLLYGKPSLRQIPVLWLVLSRSGFAVRTVSVETVQSVYFCFGARPANSKFATKTAKSVNNVILDIETLRRSWKDWTFSEISKIDGESKTNIFKSKPPEVHFTIRERVPYNKLLRSLAALGPYCHDLGPIFPSTALALG